MRAFLILDLGEVVVDEPEDHLFPFAINMLRKRESAVGKFFVILFFWWLMIPEAIILAALFAAGFVLACALCCVPILNICILIDANRNDHTVDKIMAIVGIIADIVAAIVIPIVLTNM